MILHDSRLPGFYSMAIRKIFPDKEMVPFFAPETHSSCAYEAIRSHPDIYCMQFSPDTLIVAPSAKDFFDALSLRAGFKVVRGDKDPSGEYPGTAGFNALRCGEYLIHNFGITDKIVLEKAYEHKLKLIKVKQGYSKCSCIPVAEKAIITSDKAIAGIIDTQGFDVLYVDPEDIALPSCDYGFIGGASGVQGEDSVFFCGDLREHRKFREILRFLEEHNVEACWVPGAALFDCGGLFFI